ncbi:hypothetical protein SAMN05421863_11232 [Nitrosomonas communis]|uniref:Uncharacterized protein n=1 Tax=Nitrosomonas communis TaxID=44574 RepID=A0A1I4WWA8_9PROT|nr:hypothetical protein SAMN05421863_11232 [Nitrosomonas communis]
MHDGTSEQYARASSQSHKTDVSNLNDTRGKIIFPS